MNKITHRQLTSLVINAVIVKMLMTFPRGVVEAAGNAAWISAAIAVAAGLLLFLITARAAQGDKNIIELADGIGIRGLRQAVSIAVLAVVSLDLLPVMRIFPEIIQLVLLTNTYIELIWLLFAATVVFGAYCGICSAAVLHEMFMPVLGAVFVILLLLLIPEYRTDNIFPVLGKGMRGIADGAVPFVSLFSDLLILNILIPHMEHNGDYRRSGIKAILYGGGTAFLLMTAYCTVYSYPASQRFLVPVYQLERMIYLSSFFSHFEAIFQLVWSVSTMLYASFVLATMSEIVKMGFGEKPARFASPAAVLILSAVAAMPDSLADVAHMETEICKWLFIPSFFLPFIIGVVSRETKRKSKRI